MATTFVLAAAVAGTLATPAVAADGPPVTTVPGGTTVTTTPERTPPSTGGSRSSSGGNSSASGAVATPRTLTGPMLQFGMTSASVRKLQLELCFSRRGTYFGTATRRAVIAFQKSHGLRPADGVVGPRTWRALGNDNRCGQ